MSLQKGDLNQSESIEVYTITVVLKETVAHENLWRILPSVKGDSIQTVWEGPNISVYLFVILRYSEYRMLHVAILTRAAMKSVHPISGIVPLAKAF